MSKMLLSGLNIGISDNIPEINSNNNLGYEILEFLQVFSGLVFKYGARITHDSHPYLTPMLIKQSQRFKTNNVQPLTLIMSELEYNNHLNKKYYNEGSNLIIAKEIDVKKEFTSKINVLIIIDYRNDGINGLTPGTQESFNIALKNDIPVIFLPLYKYKYEELNKIELVFNIDNIKKEELNSANETYSYSGFLFNKLIEFNKNR